VDLSRTYLEWAGENFRLNGFAAVFESGRRDAPGAHRLIRADALSFVERAAARGRRWDLVILDPPAFSNSKKMKGSLDIRRDHRELLARSLALLENGGSLYFSTGARRFTLDAGYFSPDAFPGVTIKDIRHSLSCEDFRGKKAPASYLFQKTDSST
jgi:23S rRNA G2069 N7-methylase RlmK/C1962 C5-methylase RlmI